MGSLGWIFGDDAMDLSEVVSALSLVFEVQGGTSGDGHDHPEGRYCGGLAVCGLVFLFRWVG